MKIPFPALGAIVIAGILATSCSTDHGAYVPIHTLVNDKENYEPIVLLDARVQNSITCAGVQETRTPDGRLQVTANIRNMEGRRLEVQIGCAFKDDQGFPTEGEEAPFRDLILTENAQEPVQFVAMNDKARHYTIRIREAH